MGTQLGREVNEPPAPPTGGVRDVPVADIESLVAERARAIATFPPDEELP
jgi:hypothetical protein